MWRHRDALIHYRVEQANQHLLAASQLLVRHRHGPSVVSSYLEPRSQAILFDPVHNR